jgi:DNA polymerase III delta subunit
MKFQFLNEKHESRFLQFRAEDMAEHYRSDKEYLSVVYLMTGNDELYRKMKPYFNAKIGEFYSEVMFNEKDFSSGLNVLAKLAVHLFNSNETLEPLHIISQLDDEGFKLALNTIILRRYGISNSYDVPEEKFYM